MKRYKECAVIKNDKGVHTGYFIQDSQCNPDLRKSMDEPWFVVNPDEFKDLVKRNEVQYLTYKDNKVVCEYTEEEVHSLLRLPRVNKEFIKTTEENYWDSDCCFNDTHIQYANSVLPAVACAVGEVSKMLGQTFVLMYFYGTFVNLDVLTSGICSVMPSLKKSIKRNGNIMQVLFPVVLTESIFNIISVPTMFDTRATRYILSHDMDAPKIPILMKKLNSSDVLQYLNTLDMLTNKALLRLI